MKKIPFSRKVRTIRLDHGLTQPALAKLMDVSVRTVASWEDQTKMHKHEESLLGQISKVVGCKENTNLEEDEMYKDKLIASQELVIKLQAEIIEKDRLLLEREPLASKKKKLG
tara:strand:- start:1668 stop:2006 length:339 start_codon:yes stop_codon:yes gene_type:complete